MQISLLTRTLSLTRRRAPVARLVLTTAGSSWGVIPTAMASPKSTESITGLLRSRLVATITAVNVIATHSNR